MSFQTSLKARVIVPTLLVMLASLWGLALLFDHYARDQIVKAQGEQNLSAAKLTAKHIEASLRARIHALEAAAGQFSDLRNANKVESLLDDRVTLLTLFNAGAFVVGPNGIGIAEQPNIGRIGLDLSERDYVRGALQGKTTIGKPIKGKLLNFPIFTIATPIRDAGGNVIGALCGTTDLSKPNFLQSIAEDSYGKSGTFRLVAREQRLIFASSDPRLSMQTMPAPGVNPNLDRFVNGEEGFDLLVNPLGQTVLAAVGQIAVANWYFAIAIPAEEVFMPVQLMQQRVMLVALMMTLLAAGLVWWLLRRELEPIERVTQRFGSMAKGDAAIEPIPVNRHDELGRLIESFNHALVRLKTSEVRFRDMVNTTDGIVWEADAQTFAFTFVSEKAEQLLGFPVEDWYQPGFWVNNLHPDDKGWAPEFCAACTGRLEPHNFEYRFIARDGRTVWLHDIVTVVEENGAPRWLRGIMIDVTARKTAEAELEEHRHRLETLVNSRTAELAAAKEIAEAASRAKSTFLANMSHELRTPMNGIIGMTELALRHTEDPDMKERLDKVARSSRHLLAIINDILDISKIEAERLALEVVSFKFGEILENQFSMFSHRAEEKGLGLLVDLDPNLSHLTLLGDPLRLGQILLNLTGNAIKFTDHGSITIRTRCLEESPQGVLLRIEVADTGIGITPEQQQRLFTAFEQAERTTTRKYGGTGLGLAISKRLVEMMHGEIGVSSIPGQGSTFWVTVRLDKSGETILHAPTVRGQTADECLRARHSGTRVLLAEDEPINQEVSRGLLEDAGLVVDLAEDGRQALALARQNAYALILMDMQMPEMDGVDATRAIRADSRNRATPILAMTANAFDEDRQTCMEAGMNDHIGKPVDPDKLYETLLGWLEKRQAPG